MTKPMFHLSYNQPTMTAGKIVAGDTWYAVKRPGDGGRDWEYTKDPNQAGAFSRYWWHRWKKLHGPRANATPIELGDKP
jgi:hypothetical protein